MYKLKDETALVSANIKTVRQMANYFPESKPVLERLFPRVFEEEKRIFRIGTKFKTPGEGSGNEVYMLCQVDHGVAKMIIIKGNDTGNRFDDEEIPYDDQNRGFILSKEYDDFEEFIGEVSV